MSSNVERDAMEEHGTALDMEKKRVICHYCEKEVCGFILLKYHLCGVGSDVPPCTKVPGSIKDALFMQEMYHNQVGRIGHGELTLKRSFPSQSSETRRCQPKTTHHPVASQNILFHGELTPFVGDTSGGGAGRAIMQPWLLNEERAGNHQTYCMPPLLADTRMTSQKFMADASQVPKHTTLLGSRSVESISGRCTDQGALVIAEQGVMHDTVVARSIGRFFFEAGIDPAMAKLPSFRQMIDSVAVGHEHNVPSLDDLNGWILKEEVSEVTARVEEIKRSWPQTGCSILLDSWKDQRGRSLINFLVDCPKGTIFLKSADVTGIVRDANSLFLLMDMIIKEVGINHVVQVISDNGSDTMEDVGQLVMNKYRSVFWTLCADHCINKILEKIQMMPHVRRVLEQAKTITRFLYGDESAIDLMRRQMAGRRLVETSALKSVASFLTLHNMVNERENIVSVFAALASPPSSSSGSAAKAKGNAAAAKLVNDITFWCAAAEILKITDPIIGVLNLICKKDQRAMGVLYEAFDQAKEIIRSNLRGDKERYVEVWELIDEVWSGDLHSPLHAVGYYFNPMFFYYSLHCDAEVANGLSYSISRVAENQLQHDLLTIQLDVYSGARGGFGEEAAIFCRVSMSPDLWWSQYAGHCPELQRVAVKILSQRCSGSPKYKIMKAATERFHGDPKNAIEMKRLHNMEFVHNNRCLWQPPSTNEPESIYLDENTNPSNEWVLDDSN